MIIDTHLHPTNLVDEAWRHTGTVNQSVTGRGPDRWITAVGSAVVGSIQCRRRSYGYGTSGTRRASTPSVVRFRLTWRTQSWAADPYMVARSVFRSPGDGRLVSGAVADRGSWKRSATGRCGR